MDAWARIDGDHGCLTQEPMEENQPSQSISVPARQILRSEKPQMLLVLFKGFNRRIFMMEEVHKVTSFFFISCD